MEATITAKGQMTLPKKIRDHLKLKSGDKVELFVGPDGRVTMLPKGPASRLRGILRDPNRPVVTLEQMEEGIIAGAAGRKRRRSQAAE